MFKNTLSAVLTISMICSCSSIVLGDNNPLNLTVSAKEKGVADYTYTITPILSPFNEYFFVKTDNPDPTSFRFADKSSKYTDESTITFDYDDWNEEVKLYADIKYENAKTGRVNGGYIFKSYNTDGGEIVLQSKNDAYYSWDVTWSDTKVKLTLPTLKDDADYLISTYATKTKFFDNMDSVEDGFASICLYSGSFIRGELYKSGSYWSLSTSPHRDQTFYLQSPYSRKDNKRLFASAIYPFRYDSLGFPSMMAEVSQRLNSASTYTWDEYSHASIHVTYNGETHMYGGQGNGEGQGITEDKIKRFFSFGSNESKLTLQSTKKLLDEYSLINMNDDVPRKNALTWEKVCNTVGDGAWVRLTELYSVFGGSDSGYTYLYKENDGKTHWTDSAGDNGAEIYWGGDLGYLSDVWIDGRYISGWENFVPGARFEDHPTSDIMLTSVTIPQISYDYTYRYNSSTYEYERVFSNIKINEKNTKNVLFSYDDNVWKAGYESFDSGCADYDEIAEMVEKGLIDKKYLDMVTLTLDEVKALKVDKNTNTVPLEGYIYDGTAEPGTPYKIVSLSDPNVSITLSSSVFTYNGNVQIPKITVRYKGKTLKEESDYVLTYSNKSSKSTGRYTVNVEGIGDYTGTVQKVYLIVPPADSIKVDSTSINLTVGERRLLKATTDPSGASSGVTWTSSNAKAATVSNGLVKAVGKGVATISAKTSNGKTASCTVNVSVAVTGITLNTNTLRLNKGDSSTLTATITPTDAGNKKVTWSSSDFSVASISDGRIIAKSAGTATITATTNNGKTASCVVTVVVPESEVTLSRNTVIIAAGKRIALTAKVLPNDASNKSVTWKSSDAGVAGVSNGNVEAKKEGTALITVTTANGKTATCKIIVKRKNAKVVSGDVNEDGTTDIADALMVSRYDAGLLTLTSKQIAGADINEDGSADIADALMIARCDAGLVEFLL